MKMSQMFKTTLAAAMIMALAVTAGCGGGGDKKSAGSEKVTLKLAHNLPTAHPLAQGMEAFNKKLTEKSNGTITLNIYPSGQLFNDKSMNDAIMSGGIDMGLNSTAMWSTVIPAMEVFDVPFLFPSYEKVDHAIDGGLGDKLAGELKKKGVRPVIWADYGFVQFANSKKEITKPEDFAGLKLRGYGELPSETIKALGASPGAACGKIVFTAEDAVEWNERGEKVVLVRLETSPEDITGMKASQGILTVRGGMTSHAAVVARGMGTCCVSGCGDIAMDEENKKFTLAGKEFHEGDYISIDGTTGNIYDGAIKTVDATIAGEFGRVMAWADKYRTLKVRTNADTPADAKKARELGAEGIGLCRTEHMFFEEDRIAAFREMICSDTVEEREAALEKILPYQQGDFEALYEALEGNPVTIRFLDPPLHEFVPTEEADIEKLAKAQGKSVETIKNIIASLHEFNPMMGHRGCRLAVTYPEIAKMQTKAVIRAAINVQKKHSDWTVKPEIMIPLVCEVKELKYVKKVVVETADAEIAAAGVKLEYEVGTMIEIPRAALTADEIATEADFFCFGTNDLTQMTFGFSRDDAGKFLNAYYDTKIFENDPFAKLDQNGVGKLMDMAIKLGKPVNPKLHVGICGEHGGDPSSVEFCHKIGLDYVSCSPFRVPIARLAAAQAAISNK